MKKAIVSILMTVIAALLLFARPAATMDSFLNFNPSVKYDIYYQVSTYEVDKLTGMYILRIVTISNTAFLEISPESPVSETDRGYILLVSVKAIFPSQKFNPERFFSNGSPK